MTNAKNERIKKIAKVTEIQSIASRVRRITVQSDALIGEDIKRGQRICILPTPEILRDYTVVKASTEKGELQFICYLHGNGPASLLLQKIVPGDEIAVIAPVRSTQLSKAVVPHVFLGDETTFGLVESLITEFTPGASITGIIEAEPDVTRELSGRWYDLSVVTRAAQAGVTLMEWVAANQTFTPETIFYVIGRDTTLTDLKNMLVNEKGVDPQKIVDDYYWRDGKPLREAKKG